MSQRPPPDYEGKIVADRYRVERLIGSGGMGSVWAGRHLSLDQPVAIKFVHPDLASSPQALRRFEIEAKAAARLRTRHAVQVFDHGVTEQREPFIVMEYLEGESLEHAIRRRGRLPLAEVIRIIDQAGRALSAAHEQGIVHRDLKPDNIFLARDREAGSQGYLVKLVDFGIAKMVQGSGAPATQAGILMGTPHYMSPEAFTATSPVTFQSDIWSLGVCAFAAACGRVPFPGDAIGEILVNVCAAPMPVPSKVLPGLPSAFDAWFEKACARKIPDRFASAAEAADALGHLEEWQKKGASTTAYELKKTKPSQIPEWESVPPVSRRGLLLAGVLVGASLMLGVLGYYVKTRTEAADRQVARATESARAIIEAENQRRIERAEAILWGAGDAGAAGPDASGTVPSEPAPR